MTPADAADRFVDELRAAGITAGDRVALLADTSIEAVAALAAIARVGAVAAPLGTRLAEPELRAALAIVRPRLLFHDEAHATTAASLGVEARNIGATHDGVVRRLPPVPGDVAILTSGTTGRPKVALLSAAALRDSAEAWMAVLPKATGWLLCLGLAHVAGLGVVRRAALDGVPLVVTAADPAAILAALAAEPAPDTPPPSHVSLVPTQLARVLDAADAAGQRAPASVRAVLLGGGPIPPALVTRALAAGWPVVPTYGMTETASGVTALPTAEAAAHPESAGRPLPGVELRIDDPAADGVGEIVVRTPARFDGYLGDERATAAVHGPDGWIRTGDLGRLDGDGRLVVVDRRTDLVVSGGENVAPAEVEAVLLEHPAITEAGVVGRPDERWGAVPVAAIVLRPGLPDPGDDALVAHCRARLAPYKVPAAFVRVAALPRTASGKLRRAELGAELRADRQAEVPAEPPTAPPAARGATDVKAAR